MYEEGGKLIGQRILPLDGLQAGNHSVSSDNNDNDILHSYGA